MVSENLGTASLYINNLLLSRGLLRNGQAIDFARPDLGEGGMDTTMGRVMSVINDLVLRRDRDSEQRETLSQTIRGLRADALRQTTEHERLKEKHIETQRKVGLAEGVERALKAQLRSAESAARILKEEMGRMKILVGQTRASCANEVRKRERVIEGLKKHVGEGGRARGSGKAVGVTTITIVAGVGDKDPGKTLSNGLDDTGYDLRSETNEFLTQLASGLSEENENLGGLVRRTFETLRGLSGWEKDGCQEGDMVVQTDTGFENLASDLDGVIEHLRTLLTNPSFVPLEEVEVREDEIVRLREGWERMEARWHEAVQMMDGWRKRMARNGQTVNLDELKQGLQLSPLKEGGALDTSRDESRQMMMEEDEYDEGDTQADIDAMVDSEVHIAGDPGELEDLDSDVESSAMGEEVVAEFEEQPQSRQEISFTTESLPGTPPQMSPLRETNDTNKRDAFTTIVEENTWDLAQLDRSRSSNAENSMPSFDEASLLKPTPSRSVARKVSSSSLRPTSSSRLPRPASAMAQQSPLTMASIASKLAATEREADAARVRAKLKAAKLSSAASAATSLKPPIFDDYAETEPVKESIPTMTEDGPSKKRKATGRAPGRRASRRRSTLSPWELETLIQGAETLSPAK